MSCDLTAGRIKGCKDAIGGVRAIYLCALSELGALTFSGSDNGGGAAPQHISDIEATTLFKFELPKHTASFTQNVQSDVVAGTIFYEQVLAINLHKLDKETRAELYLHDINRLAIIVQDNNDNLFLMGRTDGAEVTEGTHVTGTLKGELNGYTRTYTAEEKYPADYLAATSGVGTASYPFDGLTTPANITVTEGA